MIRRVITILIIVLITSSVISQEKEKDSTFYITKGKGFEFHFFQDQYQLNVDFRGQFRASYPYDNFPKTSNGFEDNNNYEYTLGCNWFFKGHKNKLTLEYAYIEYNELDTINTSGSNIRLLWDISIF